MSNHQPSDLVAEMAERAAALRRKHRCDEYLRGVNNALDWVVEGAEDSPSPIGLHLPLSLVVGLIKTIYDNHPPKRKGWGGVKSHRQLNAALRAVLKAAIQASLPFELDDFEQIYCSCAGSSWIVERGEGFYAMAVEYGNVSACKSFEAWSERKPFIWQGRRLARGSELMWPAAWLEGNPDSHSERVRVTSLCDTHLVACAYDAPWPAGKVVRRYTITHKQLRIAQRKAKA